MGKYARSVNEVAAEFGCDWHTVNDTVVGYGEALLEADDDRIDEATGLGLDELLMVRLGPFHRQHFSTQMVDVRAGQLLDIVPGRGSAEPMGWLANQGPVFRNRIEFGTLDLSGPYRRVFEVMVPRAILVADPFHVTKLANTKLDECRRRVQNETLGHRGRKFDPLYRCRRLLTKAKERLDDKGSEKLKGLLRAGDPDGDVATCWEAKEAVRESYAHADADVALEWVTQLGHDLQDKDYPIEARSFGRMAPSDRGLAPGSCQQRTDRGGQQPDQVGEARRVRLHVFPELPDPLTALRRQAQLGPARHHHTPLRSEAPLQRTFIISGGGIGLPLSTGARC